MFLFTSLSVTLLNPPGVFRSSTKRKKIEIQKLPLPEGGDGVVVHQWYL
jgi:hypothetical protein